MTLRTLSPPAVAKLLGTDPETVRVWIRSGKLPASNFAKPGAKRPRFRCSEDDLLVFQERRRVKPPPKPARRRREQAAGVTQYF